jgi:two-component system cell cycle sensor histidine kinase/response regulator CckA
MIGTIAGFDTELLLEAQELVHVGTWTWDVATDNVYWSDELFRLYGLEPQSLPLRLGTYLSLVHPDDRARVGAIIEASLAEGSSFQFDYRVIRTGGLVRHQHARGSVVRAPDGTVSRMLGTAVDITDRVRQNEALRASEERFRSVFEQSAVGLALADPSSRFISVNRSFARLLGYTTEELCKLSILEITHPDDIDRTWDVMRQGGEASTTYEKRYLRKDGSTVWGRATVTRLTNDDGTPDGSIGVIEDITQRRLDSETLTNQTELLRSIMDHLPVMVSMFDSAGSPIYINREWERLFGWTLDEARSIDLFAAMYPDAGDAMRARVAVREGDVAWNDFEPRARDGRIFQSSWACMCLSDGTTLTIGQDMSERRQLQQQLAQAQRLEALGQLAGGVAHDFNNLLTVISGCSEFLRSATCLSPGAADDIAQITAAADRAASLTRQLLAFSRRQILRPEIADANEVVQSTARTLSRLIGEQIQLAIVAGAERPNVEVDIPQLEQVLINLVVNARDAIEEGGSITIETRNCLLHQEAGDAPYVAISVTDDGCGMDDRTRQRIFEPFFTTKPVGKGTGLGLATVHGIVAQSGGLIEIASAPGIGTTFTVLLPTVTACRIPEKTAAPVELPRGGETVLLVEDEAPVRAVIRRILTGLGYAVLEARHGADAARVSAKYQGPIHILITDVIMPELGGREVAQVVRLQRPETPVLYISGYTDDELLRKGILEPGAQLLRKPFAPTELATAVRQMLCQAAACPRYTDALSPARGQVTA